MTPDSIIEIFGRALFLVVVIVSVVIIPSLLVGLLVSVFQAATQINEQTLSFLPRLLATLMAIILAGPWIVQELMDLSMLVFEIISMVTH